MVADRLEALLPDLRGIAVRQTLRGEVLRVHAHHEDFLVVAAVEHTDPAALRQPARRAPEEVVFELLVARRLERVDLESDRVRAGEHRADRAVLAGRIHRLEDQQHRVPVVGVEQLLQLVDPLHAGGELRPRFVLVGRAARRLGAGVLEREAAVECSEVGALGGGEHGRTQSAVSRRQSAGDSSSGAVGRRRLRCGSRSRP